MHKFCYKSPIGVLEIIFENDSVISLKLVEKFEKINIENDFAYNIKSQLDEYFKGKRKIFDIKINPSGTKFQKKVWEELLKIPYGKTRSYSEIAENIRNRNSQRAVGGACNKNPIMILIPCHRVISKNGNLNGFACGVEVKEKLLKIEKSLQF